MRYHMLLCQIALLFTTTYATPMCLPRLRENAVNPELRLDYQVQPNGLYRASFKCNLFAGFENNATDSNGVLHRIEFELTFRNGTSVTIPQCRRQDERIRAGENKTFDCRPEYVLTSQSNVYGGSLVCRVQAKCDIAGAEYNSMVVTSNVHGFYFRHWFQGGSDVIKPDESVTLCIDSKNIPAVEEVRFFVSVGRQQIIATDRIEVSVVRRDGNESLSCGFRMMNSRYWEKRICQELVLYNRDPVNRIPLGLTEGEQISVINVNISFSSAADGLFTISSNGSMLRLKLEKIHLTVDLSSLQTNVSTYLHIYTDARVKPANAPYSMSFGVGSGYYTLLSHKMLPHEIQMKVEGRFATEVAIRYFYYVIFIRGSSSSNQIFDPDVRYVPPIGFTPRQKTPEQKPGDNLPVGVTMENFNHGINIRFDWYGTITTINRFPCNRFADEPGCLEFARTVPVGERIALDLSVVPGFYDTQQLTDGLIFGSHRQHLTQESQILFSSSYRMPRLKDYSSNVLPTKVLSFCSCQDQKDVLSSNCFLSLDKIKREKRELKQGFHTTEVPPARQYSETREISQQEADDFCNTFVQLQLSKSVSTEICAQTKDPTGKADYITQFKVICAQYASTLGTFDFTQSLFNSMLGLCYTEMTYNATVVLGNSSKIEALVEDLCPENCSGRCDCLSGECKCADGFWGASCEYEKAKLHEIPIEIQLLQRSVFCPSDNCTAAYLSVKPLLRSFDSVCNIQMNSSVNYTAPSVYISGDIVKCELRELHQQLVKEEKMFALLEISVTASSWVSNNAVTLLLHQTRCGGRPVLCSSDTLTCWGPEPSTMPADGGANLCPPDVAKPTG